MNNQNVSGGGKLRVEVNGGYQIGNTDLSNNAWRHVAAVWENDGSPNVTDVKLYLDGALQGTGGSLGEPINTNSGEFNLTMGGEFNLTMDDEDGGTYTGRGGEMLETVQLLVPGGREVTTSFSTETEIGVTISYSGDQYHQLVAFYDSQLNPQSDDVDRNETSFTTEDGTFRNVFWTTQDGNWNVTVGDCIGLEPDSTCVTIFQTE